MTPEQVVWAEKYRPRTVEECILPANLKATFQGFVDKGTIPNLLLSGPSGTGKTTVAKAMVQQLHSDYILIPASFNAGIDVLRTEIAQFASSVSFMEAGRKYIILDEADYLNASSVQPALRNFMDEFSRNAGFILTCNYPSRIMDAVQSRCSVIDFNFDKKTKEELAQKLFKRCLEILKKEKIGFDQKAVGTLVKKWFPDARKTINQLQRYAAQAGEITLEVVSDVHDVPLSMIFGYIREKDVTNMRKWAAENADVDQNEFFFKMYKALDKYITPNGMAECIMVLQKAQESAAVVQNPELNIADCLVKLMMVSEWKN